MKQKIGLFFRYLLFTFMVSGCLFHTSSMKVSAYTEIQDVDVTIAAPMGGRKVPFEAYSEEGSGYHVFHDYTNGIEFYRGISWYDVTADILLEEDDVFITGHIYRVSIAIETDNKFCHFANKQAGSDYYLTADVFVNGNEATVERMERYDIREKCYLQYTFMPCPKAPEDISFLQVDGIDKPVAGRSIDFEPVTGSDEYQLCTDLEEPYINGVLWEDLTAGKVLTLSDVYEEKHIYRVSIPIRTAPGYLFSYREEGKLDVSGNFLEEAVEIKEESFVGYDGKLPVISYLFESTSKPLNEVIIDQMDEPMEGEEPAYGCKILAKDFFRTVSQNSITWYENGVPMETGDTFQKGNYYGVSIQIEAVRGNVFDITEDKETAVEGRVNQKAAIVRNIEGKDPERVLEVYYDFGKCNSFVIDAVDIIDIMAPIAGRNPDFEALEDGIGYSIYDSMEEGFYDGICWWDITDGKAMGKDDSFKLDHEYQMKVRITPSAGYEFSVSENQILTQVSVNHLPSEARIVTETSFGEVLQISHTFLCEGALVTQAALTEIQIPRDGKKPEYSVAIDAPYYYNLSNNFGKGGVQWLHEDDSVMGEDEVFQLGKTYKIHIMLIPLREEGKYICQFGSPFTASINGAALAPDEIMVRSEAVYLHYKFVCDYPKEVLEVASFFADMGEVNYANFRSNVTLLEEARKRFENLTESQRQLFLQADEKSPLKEPYLFYTGAEDFYKEIGIWSTTVEDVVYTGSAVKPSVKVYFGTQLLEQKTDYSISYKNNTNVSNKNNAVITITGKGNYTGKQTIEFKILPAKISLADASDITIRYNEKKRKSVPKVTWNGKKLTNKKDFTLIYPDVSAGAYQNPGTYEVLAVGKGNFTGIKKVMLHIVSEKLISKANVAKIQAQSYTGNEIRPVLKVKQGGSVLQEGRDYTVSYLNNKEVGKATAVIKGKGNYRGEKRVTFQIKGTAMKKAVISNLIKNIPYQGEDVLQNCILTLKNTGQELTLGKDYLVEYKDNKKAGTATVTFKGMNGFTGSVKKQFKILRYDLLKDELNLVKTEIESVVPTAKGGAKPEVKVSFGDKILKKGRDYTVTYNNNVSVNSLNLTMKTPKAVVKGKGSFQGTIKLDFSLKKQDISLLSMTAEDKLYTPTAGAWKSEPVITDLNNNILTAGQDYRTDTLTYTYGEDTWLADGSFRVQGAVVKETDIVPYGKTIKVTAEGTGNYQGVITCEYRIVQVSISQAKVTVKNKTFTGKPVELKDSDITVQVGDAVLKPENYEIIGYKDNINRGTAAVVITGKGIYGGECTVSFLIVQKGFKLWQ